jgi:hypothetical protein
METYILKNGQQRGPYSDEQIYVGLDEGTFDYDDMAWREGLTDWQPLGALYPLSDEADVSFDEPESHEHSPTSPIVKYGGAAIALIIAFALISDFFNEPSGAKDKRNKESSKDKPSFTERLLNNPEERAKNSAKTLVLNNLKAPSTANFAESKILHQQHPWYQVLVFVDAQNSFGAYIRNSFVCTLKLEEGDKFTYNRVAGVQEMDQSMISLAGVLEGIRSASGWPETN